MLVDAFTAAGTSSGDDDVSFGLRGKRSSRWERAPPSLMVLGTGDAASCGRLIRGLLKRDVGCPPDRCHATSFTGRYYGGGNYFYVAAQLGLASPHGEYNVTPAAYFSAAVRFCGQPASAMKGLHASMWHYARFGCFGGIYIAEALQHVHGVGLHSPITVMRSLHGTTLDWTLGALWHDLSFAEFSHGPERVGRKRAAAGRSSRSPLASRQSDDRAVLDSKSLQLLRVDRVPLTLVFTLVLAAVLGVGVALYLC